MTEIVEKIARAMYAADGPHPWKFEEISGVAQTGYRRSAAVALRLAAEHFAEMVERCQPGAANVAACPEDKRGGMALVSDILGDIAHSIRTSVEG